MLSSLRAGIARFLARIRFLRKDQIDEPDTEDQIVVQGVLSISEVSPRERATVVGVIESITYHPSEESVGMNAVITDGTGSLNLVWLGQNDPAGIEPGNHVRVEGMITRAEGVLAIINPRYDLLIPRLLFN